MRLKGRTERSHLSDDGQGLYLDSILHLLKEADISVNVHEKVG